MKFTQFAFSFSGRIDRKEFWIGCIPIFIGFCISFEMLDAYDTEGLGSLLMCVLVWCSLAVSAKRWHDRGKSGWSNLIILIPFGIGIIWLFIELGLLQGTVGPNRFDHPSQDEPGNAHLDTSEQDSADQFSDQKININSATKEDLKAIPGLGNVAANLIVINQPFSNFNELLSLNGVGPVLIKKLQELCMIEHPSLTLIKTYEESLYNVTHEEKIVLLTVSIASLMAHADHKIVPDESKVIKKWRNQALERVGANVNSNAQLKRGFNASTQLLKADHFLDKFIDNICSTFKSSSVQSERNAMLELCFQVMVADNYLHINEVKIINEFSNRCGISHKQLNDYRDKLILEENLVIDTTFPLDVFYGIDFFEDVESSKKFLMNEFRKWNMRINTLSPMKREGAQRMIDRISDARNSLK
jgi:uncharacterized membrane protein YhaH (DUF805 family)/predicted flap endonuclease-1-like 5' DNA nuclease